MRGMGTLINGTHYVCGTEFTAHETDSCGKAVRKAKQYEISYSRD